MGLKIRSRWAGTYVPGLTDWLPQARGYSPIPRPERWAVYVVELGKRGPNRGDWLVVGRLLERPWTRVGGLQSSLGPRAYIFASLGGAREAAARMIMSIAPRDVVRRDF